MVRRPDLQERLPDVLVAVAKMRRDSELSRIAKDGEVPMDITLCLGSGRCMFSLAGSEGRVCTFCMRYPERRGQTEKSTREATRIYIEGN